MTMCMECYSDKSRITPLINARACLENHLQYVCGTCGRCICIQADGKRGLRRWNYPFKTLEAAKLYLRTADIISCRCCGIYEITDGNGKNTYKIFASLDDLKGYLAKNSGKHCQQMQPVYQTDTFKPSVQAQIRRLSRQQIDHYLFEQILFKTADK